MRTRINSKTGLKELIYSGKIINIGKIVRKQDALQNYRLCEIEVEYPNGSISIISSFLWESLRLNHPHVFFIDNNIDIAVQTEGRYAGNSEIIYPSLYDGKIIEAERIYIGLPINIIGKVLWVDEEFRINPLSKKPGGNDIIIEYKDGKALGYDKIKFPSIYLDKVISDYFKIITDFENLHRNKKLEIVKIYINRIFARSYKNDKEFEIKPFEEIWDSSKHNNLPIEALNDFENNNNYDFIF